LPCDQFSGSARLSASVVGGESCASGMPRSAARSAAITPGPPPLVTMASRSPCGRTCAASACAAATSWPMVVTRTTPARFTTASNTSSRPTMAPVCDTAAREPAGWRPTFIRITGLTRAAARRAETKRRALLTPSMYSRMCSVLGSSTR